MKFLKKSMTQKRMKNNIFIQFINNFLHNLISFIVCKTEKPEIPLHIHD